MKRLSSERLRRLYLRYALRADGAACTERVNRLCRFTGSTQRYGFDEELGLYYYSYQGRDRRTHYSNKQRAMLYTRNDAPRYERLGKAYLLDRVDFADGDRIIDCGANIGEVYQWFEARDLAVDYMAFEPSPQDFKALQANCPEAQCVNAGLWYEASTLEFYVANASADSSFIEPESFESKVSVPAVRLDGYIDGPVKLLKLEAEGAEPEVLQGLGDKLSMVEWVTADVGFERGMSADSTMPQVATHLIQNGFEMVHFAKGRPIALFRNLRETSKQQA